MQALNAIRSLVAKKFPGKKIKLGRMLKKRPATIKLQKQKLNNRSYGKRSNQPGITNECYAVHTYSQLYSYVCGATGVYGTEQVWNLNSMFDPDSSGTGHQPYLRDTYAALYAKYKVQAVKVELSITDPSADGIIVGNKLLTPADTSGLVGLTPTTACEQPNVDTKYINNTGSQVVFYKRFWKMSQISGLSKLQFAADPLTFAANTGANPSAVPKLVTAVAAADGSSTPTVRILSKLTFYVKWYDRIIQAQS